jgi:TRAP-type uncharacterized transport system substrate-binding protein
MNKFLMTTSLLAIMSLPSFAQQEKMQINLCTGGEGKPYYLTGEAISSFAYDSKNISIKVIPTNGSKDNIDRTVGTVANEQTVASGEACHAFIAQPDAAVNLKRRNPAASSKLKIVGTGPVEYLHVLCSKESGVDDLSDLAGDNTKTVALGPNGSGAWQIWENFIAEDKSYADVVTSSEDGVIALASVAANEATCVIIPAALGNKSVVDADNDFG